MQSFSLVIYLATTDAHATVVEPQLLQCEAGAALEQVLNTLHSIWSKCIVTEV